jgi:hypothetical protein
MVIVIDDDWTDEVISCLFFYSSSFYFLHPKLNNITWKDITIKCLPKFCSVPPAKCSLSAISSCAILSASISAFHLSSVTLSPGRTLFVSRTKTSPGEEPQLSVLRFASVPKACLWQLTSLILFGPLKANFCGSVLMCWTLNSDSGSILGCYRCGSARWCLLCVRSQECRSFGRTVGRIRDW